MTQTEIYINFLSESLLPFNISQRSFEKCEPWYVKINKQRVSFVVILICNSNITMMFFDIFVVIYILMIWCRNMVLQICFLKVLINL